MSAGNANEQVLKEKIRMLEEQNQVYLQVTLSYIQTSF